MYLYLCSRSVSIQLMNIYCAELLHLDPNSPEAQVFYQLEKNSTGHANAPAGSPSGMSLFKSSTILYQCIYV